MSASGSSLLIFDWWEKLAGASIALSAVVSLCQHASLSLVMPSVQSSMFLPGPLPSHGTTWPLSAYYELWPLQKALKPQQLISFAAWNASASEPSSTPGTRNFLLVSVIYADAPKACKEAMRTSSLDCPDACLQLSGLRWLSLSARSWLGVEAERACVLGSDLKALINGATASSSPLAMAKLLRREKERGRPIALLNFRRHDGGRPMLAPAQAHALRAAAVRPSRAIRASARRFASQHLGGAASYAAVQLRSNHVAHGLFERARADSSSSSSSSSCSQRLAACIRRLSRASRRLAPPDKTVVASDVPTLLAPHQDGSSHRRHPYMKTCLMPSLPSLKRTIAATGVSFNCSTGASISTSSTSNHGGGGGGFGGKVSVALACDAGWLGLVDLVLASEAATFVALDARSPWRSAFLEWIVQNRNAAGKKSELMTC